MDFDNLNINDIAAWWGAVIATLALAWNIIVAVRSGPRIRVTATPNVKIYPKQPITEDNSYISVTAVNTGNAPTTITHFCGYYTPNLWGLIRGKKQHFVISTHEGLGNQVPHVLKEGEEWRSLADQTDLKEKSNGGYVYLGIIHNQRKNPKYVRVKLNG